MRARFPSRLLASAEDNRRRSPRRLLEPESHRAGFSILRSRRRTRLTSRP
jgi:hypothetical protein